jgi:DNA-binding CsgD family transcriptional regulator
MASTGAETVDALFAQSRLAYASAAATGRVAERWDAQKARVAAGIAAAAGAERALATSSDDRLLACRSEAAAWEYLGGLDGGPRWYDNLAAAVILSWLGDEIGTRRFLREAYDAALRECSFDAAIAARERLTRHALLFGDVTVAREAIDDALGLARMHHLLDWHVRCSAAAAELALGVGNADLAAKLVEEARATGSTALVALLAPAGTLLALAGGDRAALDFWTSPEMLENALRGGDQSVAVAATTACLFGAGAPPPAGTPLGVALRRALLRSDASEASTELFALAARYGDADEARFGVENLRAVFGPNRPYLDAHASLARAHWCFRFGERSDAIDSAGDAARAFDAIGLRRWTNEAMLLLVHQEGVDTHRRRRPTAFSLTGREQQVAHLIRRGASNREVARTLQISEHTVERHVSSILSRLGLRSRWQIVDASNAGNER